jgi:N-acetyl-anhydromuramyl-L-alanine amidase AmpD
MPSFKHNGGVNKCRGVVLHSMVGPYSAALGELKNPARRASWHFSVLKNGIVWQHADTAIQCWHAGSAFNNFTIGIEHEGGLNPTNEPLTSAQLAASVDLVRWLSRNHGFPLIRRVGLWEHREVSGEPTACPSSRIPWEHYIEEDDDMKPYLAWCPERVAAYFIGPQGARWITQANVVAQLEAQFGKMTVTHSAAVIDAIGVVK